MLSKLAVFMENNQLNQYEEVNLYMNNRNSSSTFFNQKMFMA